MDDKINAFYICVLMAFINTADSEWDEWSVKASQAEICEDLYTYFELLFEKGILHYDCVKGTLLYRARKINKKNQDDLGVNIKELYNKVLSIVDPNNNAEKFASFNLKASLDTLIYLANVLSDYSSIEDVMDKWSELCKQFTAKESVFYGFAAKDCGAPSKSKHGERLSTKDDRYLYLALNKETVIAEMYPSIGQNYSIGTACVNRDLKLANLSDHNTNMLLRLPDKISLPNTDGDENFYRITQCLAHFIRDKGFDGIMYQSAAKRGERNIVLFNELDVTFVSSEIVSIDNVEITYSTLLPMEEYDESKNKV